YHGDTASVEEWRVADNGIGFGPGGEEGVGAEDIVVQVVERQVTLEFEGVGVLAGEFVGVVFPELLRLPMGEAAGEHEGDFGGFHRVVVDIQAKEVPGGDAGGEADFGELAFVLGEEAQEQALFEFAQGAIGDEEEVAGTAGGIEHAELTEFRE